jgi:hypothetical protein
MTFLIESSFKAHSSLSTIASIRGGAASDDVIDLVRAEIRLQSLDEYAVVTSIVLGAVMDVYLSCDSRGGERTKGDRLASLIHAIASTVSFMSGMYAILLFSLIGLYAKDALGTGQDAKYLILLEKTSSLRYNGFQAFVLCLVTFEFALVANVFLTFRGPCRWIYSSICALSTVFCLGKFQEIITLATTHIFS